MKAFLGKFKMMRIISKFHAHRFKFHAYHFKFHAHRFAPPPAHRI